VTKLRQLSGREVVKALGSFGFQLVAIRGSHAKLRRVLVGGEHQTLTVPVHRRLRPGMLHALFRQASRYIPEADLKTWFFTDER
jgi:predicted RNA binding protein YcfA (HicA-like mRNA interferase family)